MALKVVQNEGAKRHVRWVWQAKGWKESNGDYWVWWEGRWKRLRLAREQPHPAKPR